LRRQAFPAILFPEAIRMKKSDDPFVNANNRAEAIVFSFFEHLESGVRSLFRRLFRKKDGKEQDSA
jgi:hypothetical protein